MRMDEAPDVERLWQVTAEHSPVGMTLVSPQGEVLTANRALCAMLRCEEGDLVGTGYEGLTHVEDRARHVRLFDDLVAGRIDSYRLTKRCLRRDGSVLWGDLSAALLRSETGEPRYVIGQLSDVTRQHEHEDELAGALEVITRQRHVAQAILDTVDVGLVLVDRNGHIEDWNRQHTDFMTLAFPHGHDGEAGQQGEVYAEDGVTRLGSELLPSARATRGEEFDDVRVWLGSDPLTRRAVAISARTVRDTSGAFAGAALALSDITDLMRAIQARDDFLAAVSHELRTPLTSVVGHLEVLLDHGDLDDGPVRKLRIIERNAARLHRLVSDLLDSAEHRGGPVTLTRSTVDLTRLVGEALESAAPAARASGIVLGSTLAEGLVAVVDPQRLRQVIDNLISNAVKYTDAGGRVDVRLDAGDGEVRLEVSDTGIGIDADDVPHLFSPFFRSQQARARHAPGVGLGLGICESIAVAHGGRIEVASTVGEGTTLSVRIPLVEPARA